MSKTFDDTENKYALYHISDCLKIICESLREHAENMIDFEKKKMLLLTKEELKSCRWKSMLYLWKKNLFKKAL